MSVVISDAWRQRFGGTARLYGEKALQHVCSKLGVEPYGTTADGVFTVQPSECLGACADAPVMLVNDRQMLSFMSNEKLDQLLDLLKSKAK